MVEEIAMRRQQRGVISGTLGVVATAVLATSLAAGSSAPQAPGPQPAATAAAQAPSAPTNPPTISLGPGLREVPDYRKFVGDAPAPAVPAGFTSIFDGKTLKGWHISKTARHGTTPDFHVSSGVIVGTQNPFGKGGLLITDKSYKNFELSMEVNPDWGCDSGIFFRTTETGVAYQITMDYLGGGSMGRTIAEGGITVGAARGGAAGAGGGGANAARGGTSAPATTPAPTPSYPETLAARANSTDAGMKAWKHEDWNQVRVRVEGEAPHVTVWINGQQISDFTDTENHAVNKMSAGPIAIQIHGGPVRWQPGGFWRWRNIGIREF
jgi:hypothetical protein